MGDTWHNACMPCEYVQPIKRGSMEEKRERKRRKREREREEKEREKEKKKREKEGEKGGSSSFFL